ncbi:hybrid sensor histidine kinase/response regulator [Segetibacter sp. 3557_3]|uniref:sensor histidine kinase n=1 Tax=Segetibacter sp. 3557_3 TaxID=2547429 RepID=UPI0010591DE0|nr:hybrid sensor histidine kinase/response regulator [Segetibacter sp. 3557_3]TDH29149.1 hybrid sensor histidine kinase/response regulator [Segetibacter sp. 3557_3]
MDQDNTRIFTILLVDDRPENLVSLEALLAGEKRVFIKANSGNEALRLVLKNDEIGLIMLDVQMPEMDGFEVARILKSNAKTREISIIFVTAINTEEQYVLQGFKEGAVDYLQKPLDVNVTQAKVDVFEKLYFYQHDLKMSIQKVASINKQLERFVYIVSHDLKSPLASIILMLSTLRQNETVASDPVLEDKIDLLHLSANHLADMINSILEYSKQSLSEQTVEEVDTNELVSQIAFLLFPPDNINIKIHESLPVIMTRKLKLQQVFQNLISNAIKYMDKERGLIEIGAKPKGEFYEFYVSDNGPGISKDDNQRIFKLFEVTSNKSRMESSTGIGLNLLKMLVEEQGGKIWVESSPGQGSTFYFDWKK